MRELIRINQPFLGKEEIDSAVEVLRGGILTDKSGMGPRVLDFERNFAKFVGAKHAVAMVNGRRLYMPLYYLLTSVLETRSFFHRSRLWEQLMRSCCLVRLRFSLILTVKPIVSDWIVLKSPSRQERKRSFQRISTVIRLT